ncbi:reverse transcriptase domain-containing protein [Tanacetum coccineum]
MRTRSQARKRRQQQVRQTSVESPNLEKPNNNQETFNPPIVTMDDNRTMAQLLEAPTEGYEDAIVVPEITANNFEIKHGLLNLVQNKQFFGHDKEDPHAHIRYFNKITSTMKFPNVPSTSVKLMLFPFSLEGAARIWLEKEPPRSILTWDDLVSKFINKFFPPSKTTNLRNEITRFQQRFDESFYEAWDRFNDLLRACPHHGMLKSSRSKSKVRIHKQTLVAKVEYKQLPLRNPPDVNQPPAYQAPVYQASIPQTQGVSKTDFDSYVKANDAVMRNMQNQNQVLQNQGQNLQTQLNNLATSNQRLESMLGNFIKMNTASTSGSGTLPGNTIANPKEDLKVMNRDTEVTKDTMLPTNNGSTEDVQPPVIQVQSQNQTSEPVVDPVSAPMPNQQTSIPFPSRRNDESP